MGSNIKNHTLILMMGPNRECLLNLKLTYSIAKEDPRAGQHPQVPPNHDLRVGEHLNSRIKKRLSI